MSNFRFLFIAPFGVGIKGDVSILTSYTTSREGSPSREATFTSIDAVVATGAVTHPPAHTIPTPAASLGAGID